MMSALSAGMAALGMAGVAAAATSDGAVTVLSENSYWRCRTDWRGVFVKLETGETVPLAARFGGQQYLGKWALLETAKDVKMPAACTPPKDWNVAGADDTGWGLNRGAMKPQEFRDPVGMSMILMRSQFQVNDPATVADLTLSLSYRGGVVVYLNGTEVARGSLPAGAIDGSAFADAYPEEASLYPTGHRFEGKVLPEGDVSASEFPKQVALRDRSLTAVRIPAKLLRKGLNVLALEIHAAPRAQEELTLPSNTQYKTYWAHVGLLSLTLTAGSGTGLISNSPGVGGFDVAPVPTSLRLDDASYGDRAERGRHIQLVGCRNGAFSGQLIVSDSAPFQGLRVSCSDLKAASGATVIPAAAFELSYPKADWVEGTYTRVFAFDALEDEAPPKVDVIARDTPAKDGHKTVGRALQPVWVTVHVPRETAAGVYRGTVTVSATGQAPVVVPLDIHVLAWTMPDTKDWDSFIDIIQSPETLVEEYKVQPWSDKHWDLIDRSFRILGQVGNKTIWVPVIAQTHLGNPNGMVRWVKKDDGSYAYDFTILDRYLDTAIKHLGKVPAVEFLVWELAAGWQWTGADIRNKDAVQVSVLDPKTGQVTLMKTPPFGEPVAREFWKPLYEALRQRMAQRGMTASQMTGASFDRTPLKAALDDIDAVAPDFGWGFFGHPEYPNIWGKTCGYRTHVYHSWDGWDGETQLNYKYGWKHEPGKIDAELCRVGSTGTGGRSLHDYSPLGQFRAASEYLVTSGVAGLGRVGGDFWSCLPLERHGKVTVFNRYPPNDWVHLTPTTSAYHLLAPGKNGAIPTVRFEMVRQGLQEVEARIFLEKTLLDPARRGRLGEELATRCQKVLDDRNRALRKGMPDRDVLWEEYLAGVDAQAAELYSMAGMVADKLGK